MLSSGDTNHGLVWAWVQEQSDYLDIYEYRVLEYLAFSSHVTEANGEDAPIGQVLWGKSATRSISDRTGISRNKIKAVLWDLQAQHGYVRRIPRRRQTRRQGHVPYVIHVYWTTEDDERRARMRAGQEDLPWWFLMPPQTLASIGSLPAQLQDDALATAIKALGRGSYQDPQVGVTARPAGGHLVALRGS